MFNIIKLRAENKRLKSELEQKEITIQYLNACVSRANRRYINLLHFTDERFSTLDFPNSSVEDDNQISINDILEN